MAILLIGETKGLLQVNGALKKKGSVISAATTNEAVVHLGIDPPKVNSILWVYLPQSDQSVQKFLQAAPLIPIALITESGELPELEPFKTHSGPIHAYKAEDTKEILGFLESGLFPDSEFLRFDIRSPTFRNHIHSDAYIRLGTGRYYKRFHKEDGFGPEDIQALLTRKGLEYLYVRKADSEILIGKNVAKVNAVLANIRATEEQMRVAADETLEVIHEAALQIGFNPEVQELSQKAVQLILRVIGTDPELSLILRKMQSHQGKYITSHSLMLAEVACALATKLGWKSPTTFTKLTAAALLHDLSLHDNRLARIQSEKNAMDDPSFSAADLVALKLHPSRAAEFARELRQLPPDVDVILAQHHERPDGSGFPRGLFSHQISPLGAIFITAHDLLNFFLDRRPANPSTNFLEAFLFEKESEYTGGIFKKMAEALRKGEPLNLG